MKTQKAMAHLIRAQEILGFGANFSDLPSDLQRTIFDWSSDDLSSMVKLSSVCTLARTNYKEKCPARIHNLKAQFYNWEQGKDVDLESILEGVELFPLAFGWVSKSDVQELVPIVIKKLIQCPDSTYYPNFTYEKSYKRFEAIVGARIDILTDIMYLFEKYHQPRKQHFHQILPLQKIQ